MKIGTASILNVFSRPHIISEGGKVLRLLLCAAMLGMLFPLQPEMPCATDQTSPKQAPEYMLTDQELPVGLMCDSEAQRMLICDLLPAQSVNCLKQTEAVSPLGNTKPPAPQLSTDFTTFHTYSGHLFRGRLHWQTSLRPGYLSYTAFSGPARAPPFRTA
jgi:hypothetical protein